MSVINQMLRDLDARGQGDADARRAALASLGPMGGSGRGARRGRLLLGVLAVATLLLAAAVATLLAERWRAVDAVADAPVDDAVASVRTDAPVAPSPTDVAAASESIAEEPVRPDRREADMPVPEPPRRASSPPARPAAVRPVAPPVADAVPAPDSPPPRAVIERVAPMVDALEAAREALAEGRAEAALAALAGSSAQGPERDALEAAALQQTGRHAEAEQAYRRALRQAPDVGAWWAGLGISLDASGRGREALDAFREAQRRGPLDPALSDYLGERVEALAAGEPSR